MSDRESKRSGFGIGEAGQVPASTIAEELEAERLQPSPKGNAKCARCGRLVNRLTMYGTNRHGPVCEWCYDEIDEDY